ncbi:MAG: tRNA pseudouridine(55) synthase TruB [Acidobacteriota bacterium]
MLATLAGVDGAIVIDKPSDWTSHDVVNKIRRFAATRRVGHLGTLDPSATGVLPLVINRATRLAQFYTHADKTYEGVIHFGYATDSYDAEGAPVGEVRDVAVTAAELEPIFDRFRGRFAQMPPAVSAKKIGGRKAYEMARKNQPVELKAVDIEVFELTLLAIDGCEARVRVHCSSGTYLRSIAHDAGQALGCGAHLRALRRTQAGDFKIADAHTLEELGKLAAEGRFEEAMIPAAKLLPQFPSECVDLLTAGQIRNGRTFRVSPFHIDPDARYVKALNSEGELIAIGEARLPHVYHPMLVL